jgi:hypothetical protein
MATGEPSGGEPSSGETSDVAREWTVLDDGARHELQAGE